jgi:iron(III) transport system ATP-binding protein
MNSSAAIDVAGVRKSFTGTEALRHVDLAVEPGTVVALLGPSGCGKTTLLRAVAGLERVDGGEIRLGDAIVSDGRTHVPPEDRSVGMVFQDWALFPHLTVAKNVAYGLSRAERHGGRVDEALEMVGLGGLGHRKPSTLSGGQQQRVALARALAPRPGVLLMDEPFSNLDAALRVQVRAEVHQLLADLAVTTIFVTHDQEEAFVLGDEVAVMDQGEIVQQASPAVLYARPATPWVAAFVGDANLVGGEASGHEAATSVGRVPLEAAAEGAVQVMLRPEDLHIEPLPSAATEGVSRANGRSRQSGERTERVPGTVELQEYYGHDTVYFVRLDGSAEEPDGGLVRARVWSVPEFSRGDRVTVSYAGSPALVFPEPAEADRQLVSAASSPRQRS